MSPCKMRPRNQTRQWLALLGAAALCLPALGQDVEQPQTGTAGPAGRLSAQLPSLQFNANASYQSRADVDGGGHFSLTRFRVGASAPVPLSNQFVLLPSLHYELDAYDFGGGRDPWGDINNLSGSVLMLYRLNQHWAFYGRPFVRVAAESDANWDEAVEGGGVVGFNYRTGDKFSVGGGIGIMSRIQDPVHAVPVLTARWHFADHWQLALGYTHPAIIGYGVALTWECSSHWEFTWAGQYHNARFRITGSGASADGVGEEQSFILGTGATWKPNRRFSINAFAGAVVGGKLRIEDSSGNELQASQYDATPILALRADLRF